MHSRAGGWAPRNWIKDQGPFQLIFFRVFPFLWSEHLIFAAMEKTDIISGKFNGKDCMAWSFHQQHFVEGKGLGGFLDRTTLKPIDGNKSIATWSQVILKWLPGF